MLREMHITQKEHVGYMLSTELVLVHVNNYVELKRSCAGTWCTKRTYL